MAKSRKKHRNKTTKNQRASSKAPSKKSTMKPAKQKARDSPTLTNREAIELITMVLCAIGFGGTAIFIVFQIAATLVQIGML